MNLKRWFAWACLALALVAEALLFHALHEKDMMQNSLHETQTDMWQMKQELEELRHSNAGLQASEILRLRKQNEIFSNQLATAQAGIRQLQADVLQATQQLATARTALQLQQEHLEQLQTENKIVTDAGISLIQKNACINNLRQIDAAKQQWALEKNMPADATPSIKDLLPYLKGGVFPTCPAGGIYLINSMEDLPTCSIAGHALPQ
jgi:hypothetical protein